ncbi:hypothetical protein J2128_002374 [Methanomicrobium sp. W14]|uniref:class I SAM-dependent methyltransferase n=1 Tax=Methanomicrobium sp. W14 TaxID=2817839 RepID=UPI001AE3E150|nr:class I SAM-dependent methyltransferase [Methanomicrobium sp. W14]MBP2134408.1 hypothetical protein [Methanomicrobium sp. W14]
MQQNDNIKFITDCWTQSVVNTGFYDEKKTACFWDKRSGEFAAGMRDAWRGKKTDEILSFLESSGFSPEGKKVLDIGCGPGTLAIPLAKTGAKVTAVDISSGMLEKLKETVKKESLAIDIAECSWWTADIDSLGFRDGFDLVLASMTPGVKDFDSFKKMMACSKGMCYYSNFLKRGGDPVQNEIFMLTGRENPAGYANGMMYPFMYLYLLGYHPEVRISHSVWKEESPWEEAGRKTAEFVGRSRECDEDTLNVIRECYKKASPDGIYRSETDVYTGMMTWKVKDF